MCYAGYSLTGTLYEWFRAICSSDAQCIWPVVNSFTSNHITSSMRSNLNHALSKTVSQFPAAHSREIFINKTLFHFSANFHLVFQWKGKTCRYWYQCFLNLTFTEQGKILVKKKTGCFSPIWKSSNTLAEDEKRFPLHHSFF